MNKKQIGVPLPAPGKLRIGDVIAIPLGDGHYGYARVYRDADLGVLDIITDSLVPLSEVINIPICLFVAYYEPYELSPWIYLGKWPFMNKGEAWGAAAYVRDVIDPKKVRIVERGTMRDATESEVKGLRTATLQDPESIRKIIIKHFKHRPRGQ